MNELEKSFYENLISRYNFTVNQVKDMAKFLAEIAEKEFLDRIKCEEGDIVFVLKESVFSEIAKSRQLEKENAELKKSINNFQEVITDRDRIIREWIKENITLKKQVQELLGFNKEWKEIYIQERTDRKIKIKKKERLRSNGL